MNPSPANPGQAQPAARGGAPPANDLESIGFHDCWNQIGIAGDGSCPELKQNVHCRNCPVYAAAGAQLLNRALPADYRRERTGHFARIRQTAAPARTSALIFRVGTEWLALPNATFQEVAERRPVHSLPHRRQGVVLGLVNVRGELLICVMLSRLLSLETVSSRDKPRAVYERLLVAQWDGQRLVFPVDEVLGIHRFDASELKPAPASVARAAHTFTQSIFIWRERSVGLLDADALFAALNRSLS